MSPITLAQEKLHELGVPREMVRITRSSSEWSGGHTRFPVDPAEAEPISTPSPAPDMDEKTTVMDIVTTLWPEAAEAIDREDFRAAAIAFRKAFIKLRPSNTDDAEPFTPHQMLLLELQLLAEVNSMSP
jgi:hypothetical protein